MSPSTTSSDDNAQGSMVPDRRHSIFRAAKKADLMEEIGPSIFEYHTRRETGLISPNEEFRWGYEDPRWRHETRSRYNNTYVALSFFKVDWDKGFTGRGVDFRYRDYRLVGPKGEAREYIADAEAPRVPETRRLWRLVDQGDDEGVDPLYDGPPIDWDENTSWSDDGDVDPLGQTEVDNEIGPVTELQQHAQVDASGETLENLQDIAAQAFLVLGDNNLGPFRGTRQEAEIDSSGEMRDVSSQVVDESSRTPDEYHATSNVPASLESIPESTKNLGKKREWVSLCGDGDDASNEGRHGPKRLRKWPAEEADTLGKVNDIIGDSSGKDSTTEASSSKLKRLRILQADEENTLGEVKKSLRDNDRQESEVPSNSCITSVTKTHSGFGSGPSPLPKILQKRKGNAIYNNLADTLTEVRQTAMNIAKRKVHGSQESSKATEVENRKGNYHRLQEDTEGKPMSSNPRGIKRWRGIPLDGLDEDDSSDEERQPQPKRQRIQFEQPVEARRTVVQGSDTSDNFKADNSSNDVDSSETDASSVDSGLSNFQSKQALGPIRTRARPTFYGISVQTNKVTKKPEWVPDSNEADDIVLLHVTKSEPRAYEHPPGLPPRIEPKSRPWTEEEDEDLRTWVQDYGMQDKWSEIAWCLHRSEVDCQTRYRKIVMTRNRWACRDLEAGLPGWVDHELEVTPDEIAQLLAEDLAKREAARKKKADQ